MRKKDEKIKLFHMWIAIRPKTLMLSFILVEIAAALAWRNDVFSLKICLQCLCVILGLQIGTNLVNDYGDFVKGVDSVDRRGPIRVTQRGLIPSRILFVMIMFFFGMSLLFSLCWGRIYFLGVCFFVFLGFMYTTGPFPLAYYGLGDIVAFLFFGPVAVVGQYSLYSHRYSSESLLLGMGLGFFSMALMSINNFRDRLTDKKAKKNTLAVYWGETFFRWQYIGCLFSSYAIFFFAFAQENKDLILFWVCLLFLLGYSLPVLKKILIVSSSSSDFNKLLSQTVLLFCIYSVFLSMMILL